MKSKIHVSLLLTREIAKSRNAVFLEMLHVVAVAARRE